MNLQLTYGEEVYDYKVEFTVNDAEADEANSTPPVVSNPSENEIDITLLYIVVALLGIIIIILLLILLSIRRKENKNNADG